ncbi:aldo/keto reductase [Brachybacterium alimentarium]|uniref:aldo/keto reductase n=1 Tax=Brachybacterium alimentarium TaxID=47845 RepID=UPI000DF452BE|nr:aldo/keto reductase [Brachybacterium alimentarium]RCS74441.1 aldo/keto reductase [Brachybacterium alimentarium]RCS78474.1 aldo/keto reductase [Brachybacterium alimentarium]RCS79724.1 aldo/keto reductase [Brachybacterium alimentarium]RCS87130.1 aldo/keto reductase [Brachybacterium alimentarium]RCS91763.1 aldo/keto reductase [Brachybacterium alimentarium]
MTAPTRRIGSLSVSALGLGAMPLSMGRGEPAPADRATATIHAALDAGVTLLDTADIYAPSWDTMGHNEELVAEALRSWGGDRSSVTLATKGGITRSAEGGGRDGSASYLRSALEKSLAALEIDSVDLYYWHRPDRSIRYAEGVEALAALKEEGLIREIGISNANVEEIDVALEVLGDGGLAAVQNEFSPTFFHTSRRELEHCGEHGIAFVPWSPLGGTGGGASAVGERFPQIQRIAESHGVSPQQVVLAWELSLGEHVVPIPGASRPESISDSARAMTLELSAEDLEQLNQIIA